MKHSKKISPAPHKKTPFARRRKHKIPLREWFSNPDYDEYQWRSEEV